MAPSTLAICLSCGIYWISTKLKAAVNVKIIMIPLIIPIIIFKLFFKPKRLTVFKVRKLLGPGVMAVENAYSINEIKIEFGIVCIVHLSIKRNKNLW